MSEAVETYCKQNIIIPPELAAILKKYAKAATKTQPLELLRWSGLYFRALAEGRTLPVKDRLEQPGPQSSDGLTPGVIRVFDKMLGAVSGQKLPFDKLLVMWIGFGFKRESLENLVRKGKLNPQGLIEWDKLLAVMAYDIHKDLWETMRTICEILTTQPSGREATIDSGLWLQFFTYLGKTVVYPPISDGTIKTVEGHIKNVANASAGQIGPSDFQALVSLYKK